MNIQVPKPLPVRISDTVQPRVRRGEPVCQTGPAICLCRVPELRMTLQFLMVDKKYLEYFMAWEYDLKFKF